MTYFEGLPGWGLRVVECLSDEITPPRIASSRSLSCEMSAVVCEQYLLSVGLCSSSGWLVR